VFFFLIPKPREHYLQNRGFNPHLTIHSSCTHDGRSGLFGVVESNAAGFRLVEQCFDEIVVNARGRHARRKAFIAGRERFPDRTDRRVAVQMIEAQ
jgi:hypothetical protein